MQTLSPFVRRALAKSLPAADLTPPVPGGTCSHCGATFADATNRNLHLMRRHADRRVAFVEVRP